MAKTVIGASVEIDVKNSTQSIQDLENEIKQLEESLNSLDKESQEYADTVQKINDSQKKLQKQTDDFGKSLDKAADSGKKTGGSFSKLGGFIKGLGIVAGVTAAFGALKEAFGRNQKTADMLSAVMTTITTIFNKLIEIIVEVVKKVSEKTKGFEGLTNVLKGLAGLIGGALKLAFSSIALIIQEAQLAWEQSFFGDKDPETIKKLTESIEGSKKAIKEAADQSLESGKKIVTNLGKAVVEVGQVVVGVVDEAQKIDGQYIKNVYNQSKALVQLQNNAKIAASKLAGVRAETEREAELLRQNRDDQNKSLEERIDANNKLSEVLEKQRKVSLALADQKIAAAQVELSQNKANIELQTALIDAINEKKDIEAQITGLFSEQKQNAVALDLELKQRNKSQIEGANQVLLNSKKASAELLQDELLKNETLQKIRDEERALELQRLQDIINNTKEGTQARIDAEIAYNQKKQELDAADKIAEAERLKITRERNLAETTARSENILAEIELRKKANEQARIDSFTRMQNAFAMLKQETAELLNQLKIRRDAEIEDAEKRGLSTVEIKKKYAIQEDAINQQIAQSEKDLAQAKISAVLEAADAMSASFGNLKALFGEQTKAGKVAAIAQATIDTFTSAVKAYQATVGIPFVGPVLAPINAGIAIAAGFKNIKEIAKVKVPGDAGGSVPTPTIAAGGSAPMPPRISPTVQGQALNAQAINALGNNAMRAYVMNSDIQNNQQRNAYLERNARIG